MSVPDRVTSPPQPAAPAWSVHGGLASFGGAATKLLRTLDDLFTGWGTDRGAEQLTLPPLLPAAALAKLDYFRNFPHLGSMVARIRPDRLDGYSTSTVADLRVIAAEDMDDATHVLPSAACYAGYLHLADTTLDRPATFVTMVGHCFRNEEQHVGLRRLWGFTMREIVCLGTSEAVQAHLDSFHRLITAFAGHLGITLRRARASDPFFRQDDPRAFMQEITPVKEEYLGPDGTAIASLNQHHNFFGERCAIRHAGQPAFTGCVAFGLERWLHVLEQHFDGDLRAACEAVNLAVRAL